MPTVLEIAHGFPPAGGSGSHRALAFARYLPEYGWRPVVLTTGAAWAANRDDSLLAEVPRDLRIIRTRSLEPRPSRPTPHPPPPSMEGDPSRQASRAPSQASSGHHNSGFRSLRNQLGHLRRFPDAHFGWLPFAVAAGRRVHAELLYSSSGPFTSHLVALLLRRLTGTPWIAELRDGWYRWNRAIFPDYPAWRDMLEQRLEAIALRSASRVVLVTDRMADAFRCQYPDLPADHFAVVPNGFDPAQHNPVVSTQPTASFTVVHAGALYYGRSLATFLQAAAHLVSTDPDFAAVFRLKLVGTLDASARADLDCHPLGSHLQLVGQLSHQQTLHTLRQAAVLLLVANTTPGAEATVPAKLFEYLAVGRPIFAVAPPSSSTADVLQHTGGGWAASGHDVEHLTNQLRAAFAAHQAGQAVGPDPIEVARYDRRRLAGELAAIFDTLCA